MAALLTGCAGGPYNSRVKPTPDGRFNTECHRWGKDPERRLCDVSFIRLLATPERYDTKLISVRGYLAEVFGTPVLFQSTSSYHLGSEIEGIEIYGSPLISGEIGEYLSRDGVVPVLVVGTFDAKYVGGKLPRLGALKEVEHVMLSRRIPEK